MLCSSVHVESVPLESLVCVSGGGGHGDGVLQRA